MKSGKLDYPAGTVRHQRDDGAWVIAEPHHPLYSMATMVATEHWDEGERRWRRLDVAFENCANDAAATAAECERLRGIARDAEGAAVELQREVLTLRREVRRLNKFEEWLANRVGPVLSLDAVREALE